WGNGAFGQAWDKNLTDEDGPYIELMTGVYTDNQPDFSWLQPQEEKTFTQYFMPYSEVGMVKNATKEAVVNMEWDGDAIDARVYVTAVYPLLEIAILHNGATLFAETIEGSPASPYLKKITPPVPVRPEQLTLVVTDKTSGRILVRYQPEGPAQHEIPAPALAAVRPSAVENNEQLYLTGLHLEQYRHATYVAADYYKEALRRDAKDSRCNNALGLWYLRRGVFDTAVPYFKKAIATLTQRNPNPYDGEAYYNLGWALKLQGKDDEAFDAFYKAVWNDAWQHAGYFNLARIACGRGHYPQALQLAEQSLIKNYHSHTVRHLKTCLLRRSGKAAAALLLANESLAIDSFNYGCLFEKILIFRQENKTAEAEQAARYLKQLSRDWVHNFIEYALDYAHAGMYEEAAALLLLHSDGRKDIYPMVPYYLGWFAFRQGQQARALDYFRQGAALSPDFCFPNRIEEVPVLQTAMLLNPGDAKAPYYLGNFWYDKRQYEQAIACWEKSIAADDSFPTAHRNLALAYFNKTNDHAKA
ncbi:MAG TPA: tetratricopeptide repeat protein, partial [Chitinophagaceae bacterium]|nr:tetratricopeptide repeat protein [Chitinophagaceae bacterium]